MNKQQYDFKKLKELRGKVFTQEQLAKKLNVHPKTISRAENGESASFDLLWQIATACNIPLKEIIKDNVSK